MSDKLGSESKGKSWVTKNKRKHIEIHIYLFCILSFFSQIGEKRILTPGTKGDIPLASL